MISILMALAVGFVAPSRDAEDAIAKHERALARIHSLKVHIRSRISRDGGRVWTPGLEVDVTKSGSNERIHEKTFGHYSAGRWTDVISHRDFKYTGSELKLLTGVDPDDPPGGPVSVVDPRGISGAIYPEVPTGPVGHKTIWANLLLFLPDAQHSLREIYDQSKTNRFEPRKSEHGEEDWEFRLAPTNGQFTYVVSLSPRHHWAIDRLETMYAGIPKSGVKPHHYVQTVEEFRDDPTGFSIPLRIKSVDRLDEHYLSVCEVEVESANTPVREGDLAFDFPPGTEVNDGVGMAFHVWGDDGKPAKSFRTGDEINLWRARQRREILRSRMQGGSRLPLILLGAATVALVVLLVVRRQMTGKAQLGRS